MKLLKIQLPRKTRQLDIIFEAGDDAVLPDAGKVSAESAKKFAETEFEKYRVIQDRLFSSDFDRFNDGDNLLPIEIDPDLFADIVKNIPFYFANLEEQDKLASFISLLDERIATQNKIIEDLKKLKSALKDSKCY